VRRRRNRDHGDGADEDQAHTGRCEQCGGSGTGARQWSACASTSAFSTDNRTARKNCPAPSTVALPSGFTTLEAIVNTPEVPGWNPLTLAVMV
jgi:hypothetical protein